MLIVSTLTTQTTLDTEQESLSVMSVLGSLAGIHWSLVSVLSALIEIFPRCPGARKNMNY